jgi:ArsR family transcriptional regulator, lead/cadmium/zinc/bismuth-responsive transcriptional repressor
MTVDDLQRITNTASSFKILADPTRFNILCKLIKSKDGMCVSEIADTVGISHSAASHQLAKLEAHSVVRSFREGQRMCYRLQKNPFTKNLIEVTKIFRR